MVVPLFICIRVCVTSSDVIHSWSLPSFGLKLDAIPGVLSVTTLNLPALGVFYGQCSEICGANHSFMPVVCEATLWASFFYWFNSFD